MIAAPAPVTEMTDNPPITDPKPYTGQKRGRKKGGNNGISQKMRNALTFVYDHGLSKPKACKLAGLAERYMYVALKREHVQEFIKDMLRNRALDDACLARRVIVDLAQSAASEQVRLTAATMLADRLGGLPAALPAPIVQQSSPMHQITIIPYGIDARKLIDAQAMATSRLIEQATHVDDDDDIVVHNQ